MRGDGVGVRRSRRRNGVIYRFVVRQKLLVGLVCAVSLVGCGGGDDDDNAASSSVGSVDDRADDDTTPSDAPDEGGIVIEDQVAIHEPEQQGGNFYQVLVLVRNDTDQVALDVGGQVSLKDGSGRLLESMNPTEVNILPGELGLIQELANLSTIPDTVVVESLLEADSFRDGGNRSPVAFTDVRLEPDEFSGCAIRGTVTNTFSEAKEDLQIRVAGLRGGKIATGGFTYVDEVFPATEATFEIDLYGDALCPATLDEILVLPNLGEDKIFNP